MSATNVTTYYEFPVFVGSDKPAWLVDWNGAMNAIDSAIHEAKSEADANATNIAALQSDVTSLAGSVSSQGSSITSLTQSLTSLQGTVNTITSLIGNGLPTTDDKTIIGAINELNANQGNMETAIDELRDEIDTGNVFGTSVDLSANHTTVGTLYTAPSDGFLNVYSNGTGNCTALIASSDISDLSDTTKRISVQSLSANPAEISVFIPKGCKLGTFGDMSSFGSIVFIPLT